MKDIKDVLNKSKYKWLDKDEILQLFNNFNSLVELLQGEVTLYPKCIILII